MCVNRLAGGNIAEMHFDHGHGYGSYGIGYGKGCVGVGSGVKHYSIRPAGSVACLMQTVDNGAFVVALEEVDFHTSGPASLQVGKDVGEGRVAIDICLPQACEIQIRTIDYKNPAHITSYVR